MRTLTILTLATICLKFTQQAHAESPLPLYIESFHHASTAAESELTGWGRYYRGLGEGEYWEARAAEQYQYALAQNLAIRRQLAAPHIVRRERERQRRALRADERRHEQHVRQTAREDMPLALNK